MQALHGYTYGGAYAGHDEHRLGQLKPGLLADIVIVDHDIKAMDEQNLDRCCAAVTLSGGQFVWEA